MILMGLAFGIIFPTGMVLGVRTRIYPPTMNQPNITSPDRPLSLARPTPNRRHRDRRPSLLPRPRP